MRVDTPSVTTNGTTPTNAVGFIQDQLWWYMAAAAVLSVIIGGARMAWEQRSQPGMELLRSLLTLVVVSGCGLAVISLLVEASDQFAAERRSTPGSDGLDFDEKLATMLGFTGGDRRALGPMLVIVMGLIAIFVSIVQVMLMIVRSGMLVLLAGALPLAAAFTNTEAGRMWFRRFVAWTAAFILYKPAAAIIYATAFQLMSDGRVRMATG